MILSNRFVVYISHYHLGCLDFAWLCFKLSDFVALCLILNDSVWHCLTLFNTVWHWLTLIEQWYLCLTLTICIDSGWHWFTLLDSVLFWWTFLIFDRVSNIPSATIWLMQPGRCMRSPKNVSTNYAEEKKSWMLMMFFSSSN